MQIARAKVAEASSEDKAVEEEVARAMQPGNGLVQATLEHLETAERSWDRFVELGGEVIDGYPSEVQVVKYMSKMSRERQRMCLAQRGVRRKGRKMRFATTSLRWPTTFGRQSTPRSAS